MCRTRMRRVGIGGCSRPSAARDPRKKVFFRLSMDGKREASNVWSHGVDARTYMPQPDQVVGALSAMPAAVAAKIEIVWPHGNAPVDRAEKVNVVAVKLKDGFADAGSVVTVRFVSGGWR